MATVIQQEPRMADSAGIGFFIGITVLLLALALFFLVGLPYISQSRTTLPTPATIEQQRIAPAPVVPEPMPEPDRGMKPAPEPVRLPF